MTGQVVADDPVQSSDGVGGESGQAATEHFHRHDGDALRNPRNGPAKNAGQMGAVAVAILHTATVTEIDERTRSDPALELDVRRPDPRVDDLCGSARSGRRVLVGAVERKVALVDPIQPPRCAWLRRVERDDLVDVDVGHGRVFR